MKWASISASGPTSCRCWPARWPLEIVQAKFKEMRYIVYTIFENGILMPKATPSKTSSQPAVASTPVTLFPTAARMAAPKPVAAKPVAAKVGAKPVVAKPATAKPAAAKPVAAKIAPAKPVAAQPVPAKPVDAQPAATKPVARARRAAVAVVDVDTREKARKPKLVRDSFTMPEQEYAALGQVKKACLKAGFEIKKSELLRIGVALINQIDLVTLKTVLLALPQLKTGRPKKS